MAKRPRSRTGVVGLAFVLLAGLAGCAKEPFGYVPVSGKVTYDDGSLIPAHRIRLIFLPQAAAVDPKTHPLEGGAEVDVATGQFSAVTSHRFGDGIVAGEHKVVVQPMNESEAILDVVPPEYTDRATTPLTVNSKDSPFDLRIPKPQGKK